MRKLNIPIDTRWELLVVNNNSSDHTEAVLDKHADALPLRRLFERKQGHCFARNCAIEAARGDLLLWTDDDVLVDPDWLTEYVRAAHRWPDAGGFGGSVAPWLEEEPPKWFRKNWDFIKGLYVVREHYENAFPCPSELSPVGANMGVRLPIAKMHRFNERLGRVGATLSGGDDCEWLARLSESGIQFGWVGSAKVEHFIPKERLSEDFLRRWFNGAGRTSVRMDGTMPSKTLYGAPRWMWKKYFCSMILDKLLRPFRSRLWLSSFRRHHMMRGMIDEILAPTKPKSS